MKTLRLFYLASTFAIAFSCCTKTPSDQRQTEKICVPDSSVTNLANGGTSTNIYIYDDQGRWTETRYFTNHQPNGRSAYKYGNDGRITNITNYYANDVKSEERQFSYNAEGRVAGYTITPYAPNTTIVKRVDYVYETNKLTLVGKGESGTLYEFKHFFENDNEIRSEYWSNGQQISADSTEYGPQLYKHHYDENIGLAMSGTFISKNLHTRRKSFNKFQNQYTLDENSVFELNAEGYYIKHTTSTNMPTPYPVDVVVKRTYRCN